MPRRSQPSGWSGTHIDAALSRPVLIVDEAQEMPPAVLAELRLLSSAATFAMPLAIWPDLKPVANVLGGQEEKFLQRARVPVDAAHGATLAALGWVLEWVKPPPPFFF